MHSAINYVALLLTALFMGVLFHPKVRKSTLWHATVTPLASIIGSGFLISGPLLYLAVGHWALIVMVFVIAGAFALGSVIRFNILHLEPKINRQDASRFYTELEHLSSVALWIAYVISICYYLKLLASFLLVYLTDNPFYKPLLTTAFLIVIGIIGKLRGLQSLESLEMYAVNFKLAIIATFILLAAYYNIHLVWEDAWQLDAHNGFDVQSAREILGFLIIIQGFETSRFLGATYNRPTRCKTMMYAQILSGIIYITFMAFTLVLYKHLEHINETSIIEVCTQIAPWLGPLLLCAALASQFSAAIADTLGGGGLLEQTTKKRISEKNAYMIITGIAILLTWLTNIYEIVVYASKGFALYYLIETIIALSILKKMKAFDYRLVFYSVIFIMLLTVILFGIPVEGNGLPS